MPAPHLDFDFTLYALHLTVLNILSSSGYYIRAASLQAYAFQRAQRSAPPRFLQHP